MLGVGLTNNPLDIVGAALIVVLGAGFFATLSMTIAGFALSRDRLMGIGQAITMPLFFASNALYPVKIMPGWVQVITKVNPLSYQVNALRGLLIGPARPLAEDFGVVILALAWASPPHQPCWAGWPGAERGPRRGPAQAGRGPGRAARLGVKGPCLAARKHCDHRFGSVTVGTSRRGGTPCY